MEQASMIGLDIAKTVFEVHGRSAAGTVVLRRSLKRSQVEKFFVDEPRSSLRAHRVPSPHSRCTGSGIGAAEGSLFGRSSAGGGGVSSAPARGAAQAPKYRCCMPDRPAAELVAGIRVRPRRERQSGYLFVRYKERSFSIDALRRKVQRLTTRIGGCSEWEDANGRTCGGISKYGQGQPGTTGYAR
jgi:hypothetical protein